MVNNKIIYSNVLLLLGKCWLFKQLGPWGVLISLGLLYNINIIGFCCHVQGKCIPHY